MRVLFVGSTRRGFLVLEALVESGAELVGVISLRQHGHETERYERAIADLAREKGIPLHETQSMQECDYAGLLREELKPDVAFVVGCRVMIPPEVYEVPPLGMWAAHDSFLPEYRGFAPLNWSIINGEDHTGLTLFRLSETMDGGDVLVQRRIPIGPDDTAPEVYERVCHVTVQLVLDAHERLQRGTARAKSQDVTTGSICCSRSPADGLLDWSLPTDRIYALVRALTHPYPGAFTVVQGRRLTVWRARPVPNSPRYVGRIPGKVVGGFPAGGDVGGRRGGGVRGRMRGRFAGEGGGRGEGRGRG